MGLKMNVINCFDEVMLECLFDLSKKLENRTGHYKHSKWYSNDFLVYDTRREVHDDVPEETMKKVNQGISKLIGRNVGEKNWNYNPALDILYDCYRIEARKEFIGELEKAKQRLQDMLAKPNSKSVKKDICNRIKKLQKRIETHKLGAQNVFLTEEEARKFQHQKNANFWVFEYTTIYPIMGLGDKYDEALNILEESGVPNIELFRGLEQKIKESFIHKWSKNFTPNATAYLAIFKDRAIEDVIRRLPAITHGGDYAFTPDADLKGIISEPKVQQKIRELELPEKETLIFLKEFGRYHSFESIRKYIMKAAKDFYKSQLSHKTEFFRWIAVRALSDITHLPNESGYIFSNKEKKAQAKKQAQEYALFKLEEMPLIISALNIPERFPALAQHPSLIAERFLKSNLYKFEGNDPYSLKIFEYLTPIMKKVGKLLKEYGVELSLRDFCNIEEIGKSVEGLEWIANNLGSEEYAGLLEQPYFSKAIKKWHIIELLKEKSKTIPAYFNLARNAALRLEKLSKDVGKEQLDKICNCVFGTYKGIKEGDEEHALTFIDIFANSDVTDEDTLESYLHEMAGLSKNISYLSEDKRKKVLRNFRIWDKMQKNFGFADYMTEKAFTSEILSLEAEPDIIEEILRADFFPTKYLVEKYRNAKTKYAEITSWKEKQKDASEGRFSIEDELMVNLEYTNYRKFINTCAKEPDYFNFEQYRRMITFDCKSGTLSEKDVKEIDFLCIEANRLLNYLMHAQSKSEEVEKSLMIVPNYSYGVVAMLPVEDILRNKGFRIVPARIGSTECHDNAEYVKEKLFLNGITEEILVKKPNIIVIDGTRHLEMDESSKAGRYPDSHQGYVNYITIINDILTDNNAEAYANDVFKTAEEIRRFKLGREYESARAYIESQLNVKKIEHKFHYKVGFWNPAGLGLILRKNRLDQGIVPYSEEEFNLSQPRMIIVNNVMPSYAMPREFIEKYGEHMPAYFDNHYEATAINFKITPNGIRYFNVLEGKIKKRYCEMFEDK